MTSQKAAFGRSFCLAGLLVDASPSEFPTLDSQSDASANDDQSECRSKGFRSRTPAPPPFSSMKATPAASKARLTT